MCGIVGGIGLQDWHTKKILSYIEHRGPDSQGSFNENKIFLGHTRLSIQDLSANGSQPMFSTDNRYVIVFNGEIYNHWEIRSKLSNEFNFRSTGDTETVLNAYIQYGTDMLKLLNGIFAFAIYDRQKKEIFIARDPLGVKPLYVYHDDNLFLFSSEIKAFLSFDIKKDIEPKALANYLTFLWSPGELTPFKHVKKILPGHYLKFGVNDQNIESPIKYYQLPFDGKYLQNRESELIELLDQKLQEAVKRQMLSDVPVGFFLSGGLDSSLIVAIAKKLYPDLSLPCFTIEIDDWDEGADNFENDIHYARKIAKILNVDLNIVKSNVDIVSDFDRMIWHLDEPQADPAPLHVYNIAEVARQKGIKVLLGGTGGDDLFSGYRRHQALRYEKYFKLVPSFLGKLLKKSANYLPVNNSFYRRIRKLLNDLDKKTEERMAGYFSWLPISIVRSLFTKKWQSNLEGFEPTTFLTKLNAEIPKEKNLLNRMLYWETKSFLVDHNLNYTDKMAMAMGVEVRVPYLDLELIEFSMLIPPELKLKGKETKYILKKVAERYLPTDVIYRKKTGFGAPVRKWITEDMVDIIEKRLSVKRVEKRGIFQYANVDKLLKDNQAGKIDASYPIWALLAIDSWFDQFID